MTLKRTVVVAAALLTSALPMRAQSPRKLDISFNAGNVTIVAENVTLAEILSEWSRKGGTQIVNAERLPGAPVMLTEFKDRPEAEVLRTLLREAPGYGAAPMQAATPAGASTLRTVFILAVRANPVAAPSAASAPMANPVQQAPSPVAAPRQIQGSPDDEIPPVRPLSPEMNPGSPATPGGPGAQPNNPHLRVGPGGIVTSTKPGEIIPAPPSTPATAPKPPAGGRGGGGGSR